MRETAIHCEGEPTLVGIFTHADDFYSDPNNKSVRRPVILFVNSGLLPNTGPFRLYVRLARHFVTMGFESFRFDLSGIGDSARRQDGMKRDEQQMQDLRLVMDHLQNTYDKHEFIIMGICTGADNAHRAMVKDDRVVGAIGIDGYFYKTKRFYFNYLLKQLGPRLLKSQTWKHKLQALRQKTSKRMSKVLTNSDPLHSEPSNVPFHWTVPPKQKTAAEYQAFIDSDKNIFCIFTASWPYNYRNQHADAFPEIEFGSNIQVSYLEDAAHIFPLVEDRLRLTGVMSNWLIDRFGSAPEAVDTPILKMQDTQELVAAKHRHKTNQNNSLTVN